MIALLLLGAALAAADHTEVTVLPALGYSSDTGLSVGLTSQFTRFSEDQLPFRWSLAAQVAASLRLDPRGGLEVPAMDHFVAYDRPGLAGGRARGRWRLALPRWADAGWYGLGDAASPGVGAEGRADPTYQYQRTAPAAGASLRWAIRRPLWAFYGLDAWWSHVVVGEGSVLAAELAGAEGPRVQSMIVGTEDHAVVQGSAGLAWDGRDEEVCPSRGSFDDLSLRGGTVLGERAAYLGVNATFRGYLPLPGPDLVLAGRLLGDALLGHPPFYELARYGGIEPHDGPGGGWGPRGVPSGRYAGRGKVLASVELRAVLGRWRMLGLDWTLGPVGFVDVGRVWAELAPNPALDGEGLGLHPSTGGGLRLRMGHETVVRVDLGWSRQGSGVYFDLGQVF